MTIGLILKTCIRPSFSKNGVLSNISLTCAKHTLIKNRILAATPLRHASSTNESTTTVEEIYSGPLSKNLMALKVTTTLTSCMGIFLLKGFHEKMEFAGSSTMYAALSGLAFINFLTPVLIDLMSRRYCVRIYYDHTNNSYLAEFYKFLFFKKTIPFTPNDVVIPNMNGILTTAIIKGYPLFFQVDHFTDDDYYQNIMGLDKLLEVDSENEEKNETK